MIKKNIFFWCPFIDHVGTTISSKNSILILETGERFFGYSFGSEKLGIGELCFNTSMTGYQEIITDPSYAGQIINFTFPHIGNVGTNFDDNESHKSFTKGVIINCDIFPTFYHPIPHISLYIERSSPYVWQDYFFS